MVLNCIEHYRYLGRPLKTIWLNEPNYYSFDTYAKKHNWVKDELKDNYELDYVIDSVTISKSVFIIKSMECDFFPEKKEQFSEHSKKD
jgi:hypothetical protein